MPSWRLSRLQQTRHDSRRRTHALIWIRGRRVRQRDDGILLVELADRTIEPKTMEDPARIVKRDVRLHRYLLQSTTTPLESRLRLADRVRGVTPLQRNRLISKPKQVKKSWAGYLISRGIVSGVRRAYCKWLPKKLGGVIVIAL